MRKRKWTGPDCNPILIGQKATSIRDTRYAPGVTMMRAMRMGLLASLLGLLVLPVSCSGDDNPAAGRSGTGGAGGATGGQGTSAAGESAAGQGGAADGTPELSLEARRELCTQIGRTELGLSCAMDSDSCLTGWCDVPMEFMPQCLGVYDIMLRCMVQQPLAGFECDDATPEPKPESCAAEQAAIIACLQG